MTIHPRHYARLLVEDAPTELMAARVDGLTALAEVRSLLAELMTLPHTQSKVAAILVEAKLDELTRSIVTELGITGRLSWLPAIARSVEQLMAASGQPGVAHIELSQTEAISETDLEPLLKPLVGTVGAIRTTIRPEQLGGITIQVADQRLDASLSRRLAELRAALTSPLSQRGVGGDFEADDQIPLSPFGKGGTHDEISTKGHSNG